MKKYIFSEKYQGMGGKCQRDEYYLVSDVDAAMESDGKKVAGLILEKASRIAELEKALRDAIIWDWAEWKDRDSKTPPGELVNRISQLLAP